MKRIYGLPLSISKRIFYEAIDRYKWAAPRRISSVHRERADAIAYGVGPAPVVPASDGRLFSLGRSSPSPADFFEGSVSSSIGAFEFGLRRNVGLFGSSLV